jgi:hypothetical protein
MSKKKKAMIKNLKNRKKKKVTSWPETMFHSLAAVTEI